MQTNTPLLLVVLDGWGEQAADASNAISQARTPTWDKLWATRPHTLLSASGLDVGLPTGQMGNSEVGHMTLGAGRVIYQDLTLINQAIADHTFLQNKVLLSALTQAKTQQGAVHILGLLSPGGVHSHEQQIFAMLKMAAQQQVPQIYVHAFLDGRDTPPQSAAQSLQALQEVCQAQANTSIASIMGRFYAMDRDKRVERTNAAIDLLVKGKSEYSADSALAGLEEAYARGETDEFVKPTQIVPTTIKSNDVVIFMNFRADRARQLSQALLNVIPALKNSFVSLTEYDAELPIQVAFPKPANKNTLGEVLEQNKLTQLRIAETEKYAHVTFFFNAGREAPFAGESRKLIPSVKVTTYDLQPAMSAQAITDDLVTAIQNKTYAVIICNFANPDMVGHTGNLSATINAVEIIDHCLGQIVQAVTEFGGQALITADHGNAEHMWDEQTQQPHTAHTTNLVPLIYVGAQQLKFKANTAQQIFGLKDVAPTILDLLQIKAPAEMTGVSLIDPDL